MPREKYQTRLDADDARKVEWYRGKRDISESEAVRRLIRKGLEVKSKEKTDDKEEITDPKQAALEVLTKNAFERIYLTFLATIVLIDVVGSMPVNVDIGADTITLFSIFALFPVVDRLIVAIGTYVMEVSRDE